MIYLIAAIIGLIIGSFLNVAIHRVPQMLNAQWLRFCQEFTGTAELSEHEVNLIYPASHCPHCHNPIPWYHNIPIVSYLWLKGRCHDCGNWINPRYLLVELAGAILPLIVLAKWGLTTQSLAAIVLSWGLIVLFAIDLERYLLPDDWVLSLLWLGLLCNMGALFTSLPNAVLGAVVGYLALWLIGWLFYLSRGKPGLGYGDYKLTAMWGAWLGIAALPWIVFLAAVLGSLVGIYIMVAHNKSSQTAIAFGPFLIIAGWIWLLLGQHIINWYLLYMVY